MITYILQKGYTTKTAKSVDDLNALSLKGFKFIRAVDKPEPKKSKPETRNKKELICDKCSKVYKTEKAYLKHIENCKG